MDRRPRRAESSVGEMGGGLRNVLYSEVILRQAIAQWSPFVVCCRVLSGSPGAVEVGALG